MSLPHRHGRIVHPKNGDPLFLAVRQSRRDHVQAPTDFSIGTGCAFHGTGSNDDFGNIGEPCLSLSCERRGARGLRERRATATDSISRPAGIQRRGLYIQAIELAAVNPPIWQVSTPENRSGGESEPRHRAAGTPSCFMN
jgi:hypothetical protein